MGLLTTLMGGGGTEIAKPIDAVGNALDKIFTSDDERLSHAELMEKLQQQPMIAQQMLNQLNAQSERFFDSGWRPFMGWIAGICMAIYYIPQFILATYMWTKFSLAANIIQTYPMDSDQLMQLVYSLLGLGVYRTFDKTIDKMAKR